MKSGATRYKKIQLSAAVALVALVLVAVYAHQNKTSQILRRAAETAGISQCAIGYPFNESIFPPELAPPLFMWRQRTTATSRWIVGLFLNDQQKPLITVSLSSQSWRPTAQQWERLKRASEGRPVTFKAIGVSGLIFPRVTCMAASSFSFSADSVGAPIFYREVNLPFSEAVKDPSKIRWRFGLVSSLSMPPIVLDNLPVCGNCHSFSASGSVLGMDVDYANDKGSYAIAAVEKRIVLDKKKIITWMDYKKEEGTFTYGLLSRVSPTGKWVVSTVKDRSVFVPRPDTAFSQLFFPVKGILAVYTRETGKFAALPGANDPAYVQSNPNWSPDERTILFTRARAYDLKTSDNGVLLSEAQCAEFTQGNKRFLYDIYTVTFNGGKGGIALPLAGASNNGRSNYFPVFSPNGKWVVFCMAASFSLLQPDSRLYILPSAGGQPRLMRCNRGTMNSWHSFSPNGRWMVFSSKEFSPYTQLFLTHIDSNGMDAPPVLLDHFTGADRAANIPEFVNASAGSLVSIQERFVDDMSFVRAAQEPLRLGDVATAISRYKTALGMNPNNASAHYNLAYALEDQGDVKAAREHYLLAIKADSTMAQAYNNLGILVMQQHDSIQAQRLFQRAINLQPKYVDPHFNFGMLLQQSNKLDEAALHFSEAARLNPRWVQAYERLGQVRTMQGKFDAALQAFSDALRLDSTSEIAKAGLASVVKKR